MPRLRVLPDEKKDRQLVGAIRQRCTLLAVSDTEAVAAALGVSKPTARDRLSHPEAIRLGELRKLARYLRIPLPELIRGEWGEEKGGTGHD